ncbi:phenazine biosynthesis protein PhzF family [Sphingomonas guangdongensis]|uniref:Phenazine biosynthesis protein PhzF family n=1 Tax=Sphingomonas guangdongensis TaxID=1141890 RepID=A0A285QH54_9SPHN|nr:PhzF family phenazine biosynthesis protein [Sphingomonas guangdongensis]SOB80804.1 phenazine biosynthesis protein PhzF family [Sphingomonas guangdongensis]
MTIPFVQIDAFADRPFTGNPAAVMPLTAWLDDDVLQRIAQENNLSETAFLVPIAGSEDDGGDGADFELRWFTPAAEVALCGHATLASGHYVLSADPPRDRVQFRTRRAGVLEVAREGSGYAMALPAWRPQPADLPEIVAALGVTPVETLWYDTGYALVVVVGEAAVRAAAPDGRAVAALGPYVLIVAAQGETADVVSRVFTHAFDIPEDPVTGSAHAVMVPYFAEKLGRTRFTAYQASARGGHVGCELAGERVILRGDCVTVIEGSFRL